MTAEVDEPVAAAGPIRAALDGEVLPRLLGSHPRTTREFAGEQSEQADTLSRLGRLCAIALSASFAPMAIPFRSSAQPLIVMSAIPFGLVGAVWGHVLLGHELSILTVLGLVALGGVVEAARRASLDRFGPILLTSMTTFAGRSPRMLELSVQARFLIPMAIRLAFGDAFATCLTLVLVPSPYLVLEDLHRAVTGRRSVRREAAAPPGVPTAVADPARRAPGARRGPALSSAPAGSRPPMPHSDPRPALGLEQALERAASRTFPAPGSAPADLQVGLEPERFAMRVRPDGTPGPRLSLDGEGGILAAIDELAATDDVLLPREPGQASPHFALRHGGSLTFEPGGQIEHSTAVHPGASAALDDMRCVVARLERAFADREVLLVSLGIDPWHRPDDVPQQLTAPRYGAMAEYFARRGPSGAWMMRLSTSLQVNLDVGTGATQRERWLLANLLSPALVASFSTSPEVDGVHCWRARVWQTIDETRTGFPAWLLDGTVDDPGRQVAEAALDADVLLFRGEGGGAEPGTPGFRFRDWIERGHPTHGHPTSDDLDYHLTTLFFEVRARGFLELRGIDALPDCWRPAATAFAAGLLYDDAARSAALELLEPTLADLPARWRRAAEIGQGDRELREQTARLWTLALEGVARLGPEFLRPEHLQDAWAFHDRFPARGLSPADELRDALRLGPAQALSWAVSLGCSESAGLGGVGA